MENAPQIEGLKVTLLEEHTDRVSVHRVPADRHF